MIVVTMYWALSRLFGVNEKLLTQHISGPVTKYLQAVVSQQPGYSKISGHLHRRPTLQSQGFPPAGVKKVKDRRFVRRCLNVLISLALSTLYFEVDNQQRELQCLYNA